MGTRVAIGLGFGFEGKTLDEAAGEAAGLLADTGGGCGIGEVVVRLAQASFLLSRPSAEDELCAAAQEAHCGGKTRREVEAETEMPCGVMGDEEGLMEGGEVK